MHGILFAAVPLWVTSWLTPLWLIGVGALAALVVLGVLWGLLFLIRPAAAREVPLILAEGVLLPITWLVVGVAGFGLVGALLVQQPFSLLASVPRLPFSQARDLQVVVPPAGQGASADEPFPVAVDFAGNELLTLRIESDQLVSIADGATDDEMRGSPLEIGPSESYNWSRPREGNPPFQGDYVDRFYVTNLSGREANLRIVLATGPRYPQVAVIPLAAMGIAGLYLLYFLQAWAVPRVSAIALATSKSEIAQPLFGIIVVLGAFLILLFVFLPYNTFGEDIKMLKDSGLTLVMILAIILGVWSAGNSVSEEIEGRTALTVLSKPVGRRQFILGKWLGILWTLVLLFVILGTWFLIWIAYKPVYDAREMGAETPPWDLIHPEVVRTVPGLILAFFEAVVLTSLSVAIATRLPLLPNFVICFSIYVLGHLTPLLVQSSIPFAPVIFIGQFIATILPVLEHFNIQAAVAAGIQVPMSYLGWAFVYCVLYSTIALLLALLLFEDRDLA